MKLQVGECYRLRNGEVVGPLIARDYDSEYKFEDYRRSNAYSWMENGRWRDCSQRNSKDIVEHIPKETSMKDKIKVTVSHIEVEFMEAVDGSVKMTFEQIEKAYAEMRCIIKAENEIKAGDYLVHAGRICLAEDVEWDCVGVKGGYEYPLNKCAKITNPAHIQALTEIYEGMK